MRPHRRTKFPSQAYAVRVAGISAQEDAMVQSVAVRNALTYGVDRVPFHPFPFDGVRREDSLGGCLHLLGSGSLARVPVRVCRRGDLDV